MANNERNKIIDLNKPVLCVSTESYSQLKEVAVVDEEKQRINTLLLPLDEISRNRTCYHGASVWTAIESDTVFNERLRNRSLFAEMGHPDKSCTKERFCDIDPENAVGVYQSIYKKGNEVWGTMDFIGKKGNFVWDLIKNHDHNPAFSCRLWTPNWVEKKDANGQPYVEKFKDMIPITFDYVQLPGYRKARAVNPDVYGAASNATESFDISKKYIDDADALVKSSEGMKKIADFYNIDTDSKKLVYSREGYVTIYDRNTQLNIPINTFELMNSLHVRKKI